MSKAFSVKSRLRNYEVHFVPDCATAIGEQKEAGAFLIMDKGLPASVQNKISKNFLSDRIIFFEASEKNKTLSQCSALIQVLMDKNVRKNNVLFVVGGGVSEDIVGFISTVLFRGVDWVFCPTTLLAQADSCIGSKSSINFGQYKNLLGSFYPPSKILIDANFLKSLSVDQIKSGIGEILHFYLVAGQDKLAQRIMKSYSKFLKNPCILQPYISLSLKIKKAVIERDELDRGERNLFNYGHTFGHSIEMVTRYAINHGQAVTMGMDIANYLSWRRDYISEGMFQHLHGIIKHNLPVFRIDKKNLLQYLQALSKDKKNIGKTLGCILTRGPGKMFKVQLSFDRRLQEEFLSYFLMEERG